MQDLKRHPILATPAERAAVSESAQSITSTYGRVNLGLQLQSKFDLPGTWEEAIQTFVTLDEASLPKLTAGLRQVDEKEAQAYEQCRSILVHLNEPGSLGREQAVRFLIENFNARNARYSLPQSLSPSHFETTRFRTCRDASLTEHLLRTFDWAKPGILVWEDDRNYEQFGNAFDIVGHGQTFPRSAFPTESPFSSLTVGTASSSDLSIYHEERHRVDPIAFERISFDAIVSELFAFYGNVKAGHIPFESENARDWTMKNAIGRYYVLYYQVEKNEGRPIMSHDQFDTLVAASMGGLKKLDQRFPLMTVELLLAETRTIEQMAAWNTWL